MHTKFRCSRLVAHKRLADRIASAVRKTGVASVRVSGKRGLWWIRWWSTPLRLAAFAAREAHEKRLREEEAAAAREAGGKRHEK